MPNSPNLIVKNVIRSQIESEFKLAYVVDLAKLITIAYKNIIIGRVVRALGQREVAYLNLFCLGYGDENRFRPNHVQKINLIRNTVSLLQYLLNWKSTGSDLLIRSRNLISHVNVDHETESPGPRLGFASPQMLILGGVWVFLNVCTVITIWWCRD